MTELLQLGSIAIKLTRRKAKYLRLSVRPPDGEVRLTVPLLATRQQILTFVTERQAWILEARRRVLKDVASYGPGSRAPRLRYESGETHRLWGEALTLRVVERPGRVLVRRRDAELVLEVPPGSTLATRKRCLMHWYALQMEPEVLRLLAIWQPRIGTPVPRITLRHMTTRWGSVSVKRQTMRLNLELGRKPVRYLESVLVHELVHFHASGHGPKFQALMSRYLPDWRERQRFLDRGPDGDPGY